MESERLIVHLLPHALEIDAGILVEERDGWQDEFIEKTVELSRKNEKRERLAAIGRRNAESQYWQLRAREWVDFLKCL